MAHTPEEAFCLNELARIYLPRDVAVDCVGSCVDPEERAAPRRCELNKRRSHVVRVRHEPDQRLGLEMVSCPLYALPHQS
jgi:hypothetical protein